MGSVRAHLAVWFCVLSLSFQKSISEAMENNKEWALGHVSHFQGICCKLKTQSVNKENSVFQENAHKLILSPSAHGINVNMPNAASAKPLPIMFIHIPCDVRASNCRGRAVPGRKEAAIMLTSTGLNRHFLSEGSWFVIFLLLPLEVLEWQHHSLYPFTTGKFDIRRQSWRERRKSPVLCVSFYIRTRKIISIV